VIKTIASGKVSLYNAAVHYVVRYNETAIIVNNFDDDRPYC